MCSFETFGVFYRGPKDMRFKGVSNPQLITLRLDTQMNEVPDPETAKRLLEI